MRMFKSALFFVFGVAVLACVLASCGPVQTSVNATAPTVMPSAPSVSTQATPAGPIVPAPPVAAVDPVPSLPLPVVVPINENNCDFSNLAAIRCYNPNSVAQLLTAELNALDCGQTFSAQTVLIQPKSNGYFTLGGLPCGDRAQVDMYRGIGGNCRYPDFAAYRTFDGGVCPPPPPPVCKGQVVTKHPHTPDPPKCQ